MLRPVIRLLIACLLALVSSSGAQPPDPCDVPLVTPSGGEEPNTVLDMARFLNTCTMLKMIERSGLAPMYREKGPFTLFAPYDLAFEFLPDDIYDEMMSNNTFLRQILLFHTVPGLIGDIDDIYQDELVPTMLPDKKIRMNLYYQGGRITACGGPVIDGGNCSNGVVRVISNVMHPVPPGDIMHVLDNDKQFTKLKKLVHKAKLQDYLKGGPFTFFPPNDDAFDKMSPEVLKKFEKNATLLRELLKYHLLDWTLYASGSHEDQWIVTVQGEAINITVWYGALWVNGYKNAMVVQQDFNVYNGVMHIIDNVLIPPIIWDGLT